MGINEAEAAEVLAYLAQHRVMTLATSGVLGVWAAAVFYVSQGFDLYFLSAGHTRHGQNMATNPVVAVTIQEDYGDWPQIKGIQAEGPVIQLADGARQAAIDLYVAKYPFLAAGESAEIRRALARVNWYRLRPYRLYFIDNSRGFGHRTEVIMPQVGETAV